MKRLFNYLLLCVASSALAQPITQRPMLQPLITQGATTQPIQQQPIPQQPTEPVNVGAQMSPTALTADEQNFFDSHIEDILQITPTRLNNANLAQVFSVTFYNVKISMPFGTGAMTQQGIVMRQGDHLVSLVMPVTNQSMSQLVDLINPNFKLKTIADAETLQDALNTLYPRQTDLNQNPRSNSAILQNGNQWTIITGSFFGKNTGFMITTSIDGTITSIDYSQGL